MSYFFTAVQLEHLATLGSSVRLALFLLLQFLQREAPCLFLVYNFLLGRRLLALARELEDLLILDVNVLDDSFFFLQFSRHKLNAFGPALLPLNFLFLLESHSFLYLPCIIKPGVE